MKAIFLSVKVFLYGYFCDACLSLCGRLAEKRLLRRKAMTNRTLVFLSNFTQKNTVAWQRLEKKLISLFACD